jgi:hypothetical protein
MRTFLILLLAVAACGGADRTENSSADSTAVARQPLPRGISPDMVEWRADGLLVPSPDSLRKTPGYVVDSIFPPDEALRRFQATVEGAPVTRLMGGAKDSETLLRRYWSMLVRHDTLGIRSLVVSHSEFAYVYFPESAPFASGMQPVGAWLMYESLTGRGLSRAFRAAESADTNIVSTPCRDRARDEGKSLTFGPCAVVLRKGAGFDTLWIAGTVIRRDGVHKLLGLDNSL